MTAAPLATTLEAWHKVVGTRDMDLLASITDDKVLFRSPVAHTPYPGKMALALALSTVIQVFEDFTYHRTFISEDGLSAGLEFSARVGEKSVKGVDMIRVNADGLITEFEVMIRPKSGLDALAVEMGARIGAAMTAMKE